MKKTQINPDKNHNQKPNKLPKNNPQSSFRMVVSDDKLKIYTKPPEDVFTSTSSMVTSHLPFIPATPAEYADIACHLFGNKELGQAEAEKDGQVAETGEEGIRAETVNIVNVAGSAEIGHINQVGTKAKREQVLPPKPETKSYWMTIYYIIGFITFITSIIDFITNKIGFVRSIFSFFKSSV